MSQHLLLKWGSLTGWELGDNEEALAAAQRWADGGISMSAACQHNTPEQKQALCDLIDAIDGPITDDWTGKALTKDQAKRYILDYGKDAA